jgi:hypothetical protein
MDLRVGLVMGALCAYASAAVRESSYAVCVSEGEGQQAQVAAWYGVRRVTPREASVKS